MNEYEIKALEEKISEKLAEMTKLVDEIECYIQARRVLIEPDKKAVTGLELVKTCKGL